MEIAVYQDQLTETKLHGVIYNDMKSEIYKTNPYDSSAKSVETWNQSYGVAYCPISRSAKIPKGQVVVGYG